ncbi:SDR family NAD(P)-dependent oxidoreductase [Sphingomonas sp. SORGH_AS_0879]|uniref:SDR family NAD(P)-dependent oxidoreductase n=1 Tax=Sphingomonas sp. SORGH_AS_0879 TaxID=3041790 RepID=UPI00277FCA62|nr:SDR family NAD(P)-dependent oxidoreductase [Sphingomonas sp. SORGH_AS_0879]MDQ1228597.1 3-oxoacyl-[acyl-carrier protein] reductase [Sphingomonas sp. SORGH_AS_0879]
MPDVIDLGGRVGVVTGASRGIGAAVAEALARSGMNLILGGHRHADTLETFGQELARGHGVTVSCHAGDMADPATATALAKLAFAQHRRLDLWVNNAGVLVDGLIGMIPDADVQKTLAVNLAGTIHGIQQATRLMQRGQGGSIVNLASIMGRFGNAGLLAYSASKAGVIGATLSAAKELAPKNIRVNAIAPGFIDTDMAQGLSDEKMAQRLSSIGMGRMGSAADVANAVLFLASDLSGYVTGQVIGVDGAMVV